MDNKQAELPVNCAATSFMGSMVARVAAESWSHTALQRLRCSIIKMVRSVRVRERSRSEHSVRSRFARQMIVLNCSHV